MFQDMAENLEMTSIRGPRLLRVMVTFFTVRYQATWLYRLSSSAGAKLPFLGQMLKQLNHVLTGADIAWQARIGADLVLFHPTGTVIGPGVVIGVGCQIQQGVTIGNSGRKIHADADWPVLGDNVYLGAGSRVIGSLTIGNNVAVGANAVVLHDIADNSSAVGVPAVQRRKSF